MSHEDPGRVAVIGLGYVGLPLAAAFARTLPTLGFDVNHERIASLQNGTDVNGTIPQEELRGIPLEFTADPALLATCDAFVVTVPTPVDDGNRPDLRPVVSASQTVALALGARAKRTSSRALVVFESTVYPGCTEEVCAPIIERASGLPRSAFRLGYSPERINPGDSEHTLERVVKVVSGEDAETLDDVARLYERVVKAGVHRAPSIAVAEAAKAIENTQRDVNIALMNELAILFHKLGLDTRDVLAAARTKWNFLPFRPGLVGGHCIPVDPYYLTHKAEEVGYRPQVILAGRGINEAMPAFIASEVVKLLRASPRPLAATKVLVLGATFKPDVPDVRNSRVVELVEELRSFGFHVDVHDPLATADGLPFPLVEPPWDEGRRWEVVVLAVGHREFARRGTSDIIELASPGGAIVDLPGLVDGRAARARGLAYWEL